MSSPHNEKHFQTTHWSLVVSSRKSDLVMRQKSLEELCSTYWYPLFAYLRRKGNTPEDAADHVQGFFAELIDKSFLDKVSPEKGRFRWFLMLAIKRFVSKQIEKSMAIKRGGDRQTISINIDDAEQRYQLEPVDGWTPEKLFDRRWALEVLQQALHQVRDEHQQKGKLELFVALQPTLAGVQISQDQYEEIATRFSMTPGAVKVAAMRLRDKYRKAMQSIVGQTLADSENVDDELQQLLTAIRG
jgi:RNA polymerase sigma-70 factor (ECF subfamily)